MRGVWTLSLRVAAATGPSLQALYTSHGTPIVLKPSVSDYTVVLNAPTPSVALIPKINVDSRNYMAAAESVSNRNDTSFWENLSSAGGEAWHNWSAPSKSAAGVVPEPMCDTRVRMSWNGQPRDGDSWIEAEPSALALMKQIPLPEDGQDLLVKVELEKVAGESKPQRRVYSVRYKQLVVSPTGLVGLEATDNNDQKCIVAPTLAEDVQDYFVYADPSAKRVTLSLRCRGSDSELYVDGNKQSSRRDADGFHLITLDRNLAHHTQLVQVACTRPKNKYRPPHSTDAPTAHAFERRYAIRIQSDYSLAELDSMPTKIQIPAIHSECVFKQDVLKYYCPDPELPYHLVQLHTENNPAIKYTLFNQGRSVELRLLHRELSIPFTYTGSYTVRLEAGRFRKDYPLYFDGSLMRTMLAILGSILGTLLFVLSGALLAIIGAASVYTLGFPIGATEIAGSLAFLIQYLCFSQTLKGSPRLTEFTEPLKWFTLFAPPPVSFINDDDCSLQCSTNSHGGRVGDLKDYRNAQGALAWGLLLICGFMCLHSGVLFRFLVLEKNYTMPHHVKFGGWEKRVLHSLLFPLAVAATYCLAQPDMKVCPFYQIVAGAILAGYLGWIFFEATTIYGMVSGGNAVWIWNSSVREDGRIEDESGYWTDALADQLLTQPLNRTVTTLRKIFPFSWVSPVADIVPQRINTTGLMSDRSSRPGAALSPVVTDEEVLRPTQKYRIQKYQPASYGLSKTPQCVEVVRCRKPGGLCRGQRLVAGLLRTTWLDILFTYESLTQLHSNVTGKYFTTTSRTKSATLDPTRASTGTSIAPTIQSSPAPPQHQSPSSPFVVPLMVKTSQLSGPITGGTEMFFFDGTRVPFIRIADCLYKLIVAVCLGYVLAMHSSAGDDSDYYGRFSGCFGLIAALSFLVLCYTATVRPYTRLIEGWLSFATHLTVLISSIAFAIYYATTDNKKWSKQESDNSSTVMLADAALWLTVLCCFGLGFYSIVIDSSILAAVLCPPLDETKFLESLANVSVAISADGRRVETPGYSKFPVQEILLQASQTGRNRVHVAVTPSKQEPCFEFSERDIRNASQNATLALPMATVVTRSLRESLGYKYMMITKAEQISSDVSRLADFLVDDEPNDAFPGTVAREITRHIKYQIETRGRNGQTLLTVNIAPPNNAS